VILDLSTAYGKDIYTCSHQTHDQKMDALRIARTTRARVLGGQRIVGKRWHSGPLYRNAGNKEGQQQRLLLRLHLRQHQRQVQRRQTHM